MSGASPEPPATYVDELPLASLLPVIRVVRARGTTSLDTDQEVIALYEDRIIAFRKKKPVSIPAAAYDPGRHDALLAVKCKGPRAEIPVEQVAKAWATEPIFYGSRWLAGSEQGRRILIQDKAGAILEVHVPEDPAQAVMAALRRLFGERFIANATPGDLPSGANPLLPKRRSRALRLLCAFLLIGVAMDIAGALGQPHHRDAALFFTFVGAMVTATVSFLFLVLVAGAVSNPHSEYKKKKREEKHRAKQVTADHSGAPPDRSPSRSFALKALGVLALVTGFVAGTLAVQFIPWHQADGLIEILCYLPATCLIYYGYRLGLRSAEDVRREDSRPPILYLRPFEADAKSNFNPRGFVPQLLGLEAAAILQWLGPLGNVNPVRLIRLLFSRSADHAEEQMAAFLEKHGPFVAIGKPGERLALGGAARFYVHDEEWQGLVHRLMREASMIVLQPGETEHVWWEIRETFRLAPPGNVLFILLHFHKLQWKYERFRLRFEKELGRSLPRYLGENAFLYFSADQAYLLPTRRRPYVAWPLAGCAIDFKRTLAPFFASRRGEERAVERPPGAFRSFVGAVFALVVWILVIGGASFAGGLGLTQVRLQMEAQRFLKATANSDLLEANGPEALPYQVRIPRNWKPSDLGGNTPIRAWELGSLGACFVSAEAPAVGMPATSQEYARLVLGPLRNQFHSVQVLGEQTLSKDGRNWMLTRLKCKGGGGLFSHEAALHGSFFIRDAQMLLTLWTYAGPDGCLQFRTAVLESVAGKLEPILENAFANFSLASPDELRRRSEEAGQLKQRKEEEAMAATVAQGNGKRIYKGRRPAYSLALGSNWQPLTDQAGFEMLFALGNHAALGVQSEPLDAVARVPTASEYADLVMGLLQKAVGSPIKETDRSVLTIAGERWVRVRYYAAPNGSRFQYTGHFCVTPNAAYQLIGWTDFQTPEAHDRLIEPALAGFLFP